jgi:hypothetical protein
VVVTCTIGGAISGYWATGSVPKATAPAMTITRDTTVARIGRSIKTFEIMVAFAPTSSIDNNFCELCC